MYCKNMQGYKCPQQQKTAGRRKLRPTAVTFKTRFICYRTYSMITRRLGSVPVEYVVMFSISCNAA